MGKSSKWLDRTFLLKHNFSQSIQDKIANVDEKQRKIVRKMILQQPLTQEDNDFFAWTADIVAHVPDVEYDIGNDICDFVYGKDKSKIGEGVCIYAKNNSHECFAEAMTDAIYNGEKAKPMSKKIKKCFDLFNEARKGGDEDWYYNTTQKLKNGEINLDE